MPSLIIMPRMNVKRKLLMSSLHSIARMIKSSFPTAKDLNMCLGNLPKCFKSSRNYIIRVDNAFENIDFLHNTLITGVKILNTKV